ncbi:hypothetical protein niasHT_005252 [Heterodera trifolii]|uniref:Phosphorylase b kinase regulatory subunit n=1 Tax=Heterodera trifolii TaxID=157864 RepID=A0ABD2LS99_9BILA
MERQKHGSQDRVPGGTIPFLWAQSLYVLCCLLHDRYLTPAELDPLSRRLLATEKRPPCEVQVVILAEGQNVKEELLRNEIEVQMISELETKYAVLPASVFAKILQRVGQSTKLNLSGRPADRDVQLLSTSRLYHVGNKLVAFTPQFMDVRRSHLVYDIRVLMDEWSSELYYIYNSWNSVSISGRPLVVLVISDNMLQTDTVVEDTPRSFITDITQKSQKSAVLGALKKIKNGYIGGARVVMGNISDFSSTTSVSKLEFQDGSVEQLFTTNGEAQPRSLPRETPYELGTPRGTLRRSDSVRGRWFKQFNTVQAASMRHRSIVLDSNDADLLKLRLANATVKKIMEPTVEEEEAPQHTHLLSSYHTDSIGENSKERLQHSQLEEMEVADLITMLAETTLLDEQASIIHFLWLKLGPNFDTKLANIAGVTVRILIEEVYIKACESRDWSWARLTAGLLKKQLDELEKAVTHLLVRQKQITVGMPSKNEEAITIPKNKEELLQIFTRCYSEDPNSFILAQELIVSLGSLVRTDPRLFVEMFRLRIGLIIQVLASELARLRNLNAEAASQHLLSVSPFELKSMLLSLLSGRLLEESAGPGTENEFGVKGLRTGIGSFRKQIEERKSMRERAKSMRARLRSSENLVGKKMASSSASKLSFASLTAPTVANAEESPSDSEDSLAGEEFQFGIWLRHRRIDGALNRVPSNFYANLWDTVRMFPHGISVDGIILSYGLTQEMTRNEIKFALQVEQVLNQIAEPEYRELIVEVLTLLGKLRLLLMADPQIPDGRPFEVEYVLQHANRIFVEHNAEMGTIVLECCGSGIGCDGARGICRHFYDTAPAGEFGTVHYIIRAAMDIFAPS